MENGKPVESLLKKGGETARFHIELRVKDFVKSESSFVIKEIKDILNSKECPLTYMVW